VTLNSKELKPASLAIAELRLSESNKQANKQASRQASKQTNKQANK